MLARKLAPFAALFAFSFLCAYCSGAHAAPRTSPIASPRASHAAATSATATSRAAGALSSHSAPDAFGNTFFAWVDTRGPSGSGIFVQRMNAAGVPEWGEAGVPISVAPGYQWQPIALADGSGGVYVVWQHDAEDDMTTTDIYVQHVDAVGTVVFPANGLAVCTANERQTDPQIVSDGGTGVLIAWQDARAGGSNIDIYAQRVNAVGTPLWAADGVPVCTASRNQVWPMLVEDGAGGAIVGWADLRTADEEGRIFAQRFDATGAMLWSANGVAATSTWGDQFQPTAVSDGAGGVILLWGEGFALGMDVDVRAQRLSAVGTPRWGANGLTVCANPALQFAPRAISDGANGAVVMWADDRVDPEHDFYAQRLDSSGVRLWDTTGVVVCADANGQLDQYLAPDGTGGFIAVWRDLRASQESDTYAQRVNGSGAAQWTADGILVAGGRGYQYDAGVVSDGAGGVIVNWTDTRSRMDQDVYAQRLDASGVAQWAAGGVAVHEVGVQAMPASVHVGGGVTAIAWAEKRAGEYDIRARMINASGAPLWSARGVCVATDLQYSPAIAADGAGGAIVVWTDQRADANPVLYAQRFDATGAMLWTTNGAAVANDTSYAYPPQIVATGDGGAVVVWDRRVLGVWEVRAQRLSAAGAMLWGDEGVRVADDATEHGSARAVTDGAGGVIVVYQHDPYGFPQLTLVQRVDSTGARPWGVFGTGLNHAGWGQFDPAIVADGFGGAIVAWADTRAATSTIYAHRVRANGTTLWGSDGVAVSSISNGQYYPRLAADGAGGAFFAYASVGVGGEYDVFAQHLDSTGTRQWGTTSRTVCSATGYQIDGRVLPDGAGGAFFGWADLRSADGDVYVQRLDASGLPLWTANGVAVETAAWDQHSPFLLPDGGSGFVITWLDQRDTGRGHVYAQRFDATGAALWSAEGVVPTFLSLARMHASPDATHLEWWAGNSVQLMVAVERRETNGEWQSLATLTGDGTGLFVYDDRAVTPGRRYAYRVSILSGGAAQSSAETWVDVPVRARLALAGAYPNPASRDLRVAFALRGGAPARLELLDVAGRVAKRWTLDGFDAGEHAVTLGDTRTFAPGVYVLRLTEGAAQAHRRVTIVR